MAPLDAVNWKFAESENELTEVAHRALLEGPQRVRGRDDAVVVVAESEYQRLAGTRVAFVDFLLAAPDTEDLDLARERELVRDTAL